ncbi:MAG: hypothetical protein JOZ91_12205 [Candidatus Eremiobacteraeota bacterium]|nr:hypothetical protein [Candidatus Eremiobacteraeota bacterium]MBV8338547.1 hypothetical protein [Candidatus Eremiobacteraeota bacterium]MBV8461035.1 hypothetical protein [Candidatus Eremiobacteraeota bacterium]MBV8595794.1 hypothetical protein [Candidatus Eremiobacteraeota bacterium]MBV8669837.1 hypothetical protein [Candidatus Eremiobacteraeota bacterium]
MAAKLLLAINILVLIALPLQTLELGVQTGGPQFRKLRLQPGLALRFFLASFVVMPALAILLDVFERVPNALWVGLALMSMSPPAPPAARRLLKTGDFDIALAWQAEAFLISVVTVPITCYLIAAVLHLSLDLNFVPVLVKSVLFYGAPMVVGLLIRRLWPQLAAAMVKPLNAIFVPAFALLTLLVWVVGAPAIWHFGVVNALIVVSFVILAIVVAYILGGPDANERVTLAVVLAARFPLPALLLAQANGKVQAILPVVLVYIVAGVIAVPLFAKLIGAKPATGKPAAATAN